jgi:hypothetical protein
MSITPLRGANAPSISAEAFATLKLTTIAGLAHQVFADLQDDGPKVSRGQPADVVTFLAC